MAINPGGTLPPELYEQQQQLNRQQQMAQMLMQQGQQQPQGQMVSGRYVAPSFFQNILPLVQTYAGTRLAEKGDKKAMELASALRQRYGDEIKEFRNLMQGREELAPQQAGPTQTGQPIPQEMVRGAPNLQGAYDFAATAYNPALQAAGLRKLTEGPESFTLTEGAIRYERQPDGTIKKVASGAEKFRAPTAVDMGTMGTMLIYPDGRRETINKGVQGPAGQVVETANGPMIVNTRTGDATPIMAGGQPLTPKLSTEQAKDITAVNQQRATIEGAIADVNKNKSAFSFGRGLAQNAPYGESIAGRFEKPEDTQARAYVFNNVSAVIKERAGTAQSAQELTRLNSFLPATTDNADQIVAKLNGFKQYLNDYEKGTRVPTSRASTPSTPSASNVFTTEADAQKAFSNGNLKVGDKITINGVTGTWR
jgi:hypothetical protein